MHATLRRPLPAIALGLTLFGSAAVAIAAGASIQDAREAAEDTPVVVEGVVSVPSGTFAPNDEGFAIQAGKVGIYIHDSMGQTLELGQTVTVSGIVGDSYGQVYGVYPDSIQVTGTHPVHPAKPMDTGDINEDSEGRLVRVRGTVMDAVFDDAPYGWVFHLDDGSGETTVFIYTGAGVDVSGIEEGDEFEITGFSGQFLDHYEVNPRSQSDIVER
ncbi:hypothetical protein DB30_07017 [Enhygromyxa salina]|uniref:OB-fold nucleic acid binding domain protein n=1 Tax=Enhygromyxa salina TaxID=215803 RepID=A0A0C1ZTB1_9BACT|nr:DNA-binding protein [Enhygromyxa salina]KIG14268.1 hypothetical protein DB30_07017 [Enhygromyxa salina]